MSETIDTVGVAGDRIRSIIERVEKVEEEIKELMEAKKEIFLEAKGEGLDVKILKEIL
ncbi:GapR family DNA-binding domain-containing protein, partial [Methylobacterium sp.]